MEKTKIDPSSLISVNDTAIGTLKELVISELKWLIDEAETTIKRLEKDQRAGLLGAFQNTWSLFQKSAKYDLMLEVRNQVQSLQSIERK